LKDKGSARVTELKEKITYWENILDETTDAEEKDDIYESLEELHGELFGLEMDLEEAAGVLEFMQEEKRMEDEANKQAADLEAKKKKDKKAGRTSRLAELNEAIKVATQEVEALYEEDMAFWDACGENCYDEERMMSEELEAELNAMWERHDPIYMALDTLLIEKSALEGKPTPEKKE